MSILKIAGLAIIIAVLGVAGMLLRGISRLEREIDDEIDNDAGPTAREDNQQ
ncbi:MAG TPA: hypothetical protein VMW78_01885 [Anaerolineae bacterium]|nr:hypothetical protein [Anaerolineae bacterium]